MFIATLHDGSFLVTWNTYNGTDYDIRAQMYLPFNGFPRRRQPADGKTTKNQFAPHVTELADGQSPFRSNERSRRRLWNSIRTVLLAINQSPIATGAVALAPILENSGARLITQAELIANASDPDVGQALQVTGLAIASGQGKLVDNHNGTWSYTPTKNDNSSVSFTYQVTDGLTSVADSASLDITPGTVRLGGEQGCRSASGGLGACRDRRLQRGRHQRSRLVQRLDRQP